MADRNGSNEILNFKVSRISSKRAFSVKTGSKTLKAVFLYDTYNPSHGTS